MKQCREIVQRLSPIKGLPGLQARLLPISSARREEAVRSRSGLHRGFQQEPENIAEPDPHSAMIRPHSCAALISGRAAI